MSQLEVDLNGVTLANPVMPASGCFGPSLGELVDLSRLGAVVTKTVFAPIRSGNPAHRLTETADGMLNSVGIPSPGIDGFRRDVLPAYQRSGAPVVISIGGLSVRDYLEVAEGLAGAEFAALEVNISCPNLEHGGLEVGSDPEQVRQVIAGVVARTDRPVFAKLTPNVTRITEIAIAADEAGARGLTVANTVAGMAIDIHRRRPVLGNGVGGLSGPAIKPLAVRMVHEVAGVTQLPIIGCGGITTAADVAEFLIAGASAVQVGTATFTQPDAMITILDELPALLSELGVSAVAELTRTLALDPTDQPAVPGLTA
ncbi:MAG: dihydroorotate dehydrogenase [Propionibacteriaceae bacterium]